MSSADANSVGGTSSSGHRNIASPATDAMDSTTVGRRPTGTIVAGRRGARDDVIAVTRDRPHLRNRPHRPA